LSQLIVLIVLLRLAGIFVVVVERVYYVEYSVCKDMKCLE